MKHAIVVAHPRQRSFIRLLADTYAATAADRGEVIDMIDLYALGFDPRLTEDEIPSLEGAGVPGKDVVALRSRLNDADVFALFYPIWFGGPPAILKGFVDRVFTAGFGYQSIEGGGLHPLLKGRKLISVTASGSENEWLVESGGWDAVRVSFDRRLAGATGLEVLEHVNFGGVDAKLEASRVSEAVEGVKRLVGDLF